MPKQKARSKSRPKAGHSYLPKQVTSIEGYDELGPVKRKIIMTGNEDGSLTWYAETLHPGMKEPYVTRESWAPEFVSLFMFGYSNLMTYAPAYRPQRGIDI